MPKDEAERARPPAHLARTRHPATHPQRAAQPHRHPDRVKGPHEPPVTMGTDRKDRHESPAKPPARRPAVMRQPDDASEQGHDLRLLMRRGLISEKALGRSMPGYQEGGRPRLGEPALVGELGSDPASAMSAKIMRGEPMTQAEQDELTTAMGAGAGIGAQIGGWAGAGRGVWRAMNNKEGLGVFGNSLAGTLEGGGVGAVLGALAEHFGGWRPLRDAIDAQAMSDMQPAASGEREPIPRPLNP